ncbi:DNA polymerase alpha/epsilon subunit B-domain-containing protein [Massariosphaeria phaeospora]|uniref:DNA polymerase alpha/epsilon subunit B-domain-containing protein n=1 Tax=Massariosphaeria phaeospora TaxID=100035 RepID=A0A7C8ICX3_9PLEO|nr:DNA polymerase alpha/epsilon subunit B-domain-containing protein [Massariosphaeria phaeospora]
MDSPASMDSPSGTPFDEPAYLPSRLPSAYSPLHTYELPKGADRHYQQQFADMYFTRLTKLRDALVQRASEAWDGFELGGERAHMVERVLDVRQGELCWVVGTVYMELGRKPNVLDDLSNEHWIAAPPPRETYVSQAGLDQMMLEDESGRLRVTGETLHSHYVTGCVLAALGTEKADGTFHVIATQYADLPRQPQRWEREDSALAKAKQAKPKREKAGKLAIVSGLEITGTPTNNVSFDLLLEYLNGEATGPPDQSKASNISRLVIAGDSLARSSPILSREDFLAQKEGTENDGFDPSEYRAMAAQRLDAFLAELLPTMPITLLPGSSDPANVALPQQPLHPTLFTQSRQYANPPAESNESSEGLDSVTNPWEGDIEGWRVLGTGGQTVEDLLKYVDSVKPIEVMEMMMRWRCVAPTAPDTLWCYPFQDDDPMVVRECPHIYFAGNQKRFAKRVITGPADQQVLLVSVPKFSVTKAVVLVDLETMDVELVRVGLWRRRRRGTVKVAVPR